MLFLVAAAALAPLQVTLRGGLSVTVFEAQCQEEALERAIEEGSDPYGSVCWPSSVMLADELVALAERRGGCLSGLRVLEVGAGSGLVSVVALHLGAEVVATDVADLALDFLLKASMERAAENGARGTYRIEKLDLLQSAEKIPSCDLICASDVLYEKALAEALGRILGESDSSFVVTDPGRREGREIFLRSLKENPAFFFEDKELTASETGSLRLADARRGTRIGVCKSFDTERQRLLSR